MSPSPTDAGSSEMTATELKERMDREQTLALLDIREAFEREIADLPAYGQLHIPLNELQERLHELDPSAPTVVYCRTGNRSAWAVQFMRSQGFETVWNLDGGIMAWRDEVDPSLEPY